MSAVSSRAAWWAVNGALAGVALTVGHLLLLKRTVHSPFVLVGWIGVAWGLAAMAAAIERRGGTAPQVWSRIPTEVWVVLAGCSALLPLFDIGFMRATGDGRGFFAQVHSIVVDLDLDYANNLAAVNVQRSEVGQPLGMPVLWLPFYLAAHAWLGLLNLLGGDHVRDGLANPYQRAIGLGTFLYATAAIVLMTLTLRRWFDRPVALMAVGGIVLATPVAWYMTVDASMSHGASLFAATLFFWVCLTRADSRTRPQWGALIGAAALMAWVRPQNALFLVVLAPAVVQTLRRAWKSDDPAARRDLVRYAAVAAALGAAGLFLLRANLGYLLSQQLFTAWNVGHLLGSPYHGLLSSSPILVLAILGLIPLARHDRSLAAGLAAVVALQILVNGTTNSWNAGASFGARRFVASALPFAFGLAATIRAMRTRPLVPVALLGIGLVGLNLAMVDAMRRGQVTRSHATSFERMTGILAGYVGNPFVLPGAALFAWKHGVPLAFYDGVPARKYRNLRIDVGAPNDRPYLFGDWHAPERGPSGNYRWAGGNEAGVLTQVRDEHYLLRVEAAPFGWSDASPQELHILLGDVVLGQFEMRNGMRTYEVEIPRSQMPGHDWLRIGFRFARSTAPRDVIDSADARELAVMFGTIEFRSLEGRAP